jgi:hypothetical protein
MKAKEYTLLANCIESGVESGWRYAYKYTDSPSRDTILNAIVESVLLEVSEAFWLDEEELPH